MEKREKKADYELDYDIDAFDLRREHSIELQR
jgi:hypothetical protein